jgi:SAM-dependent methyltransferase
MSDPLEFTGERFTPECVREIWYEHFHRYVFAGSLLSGKRVLDAACGEGYGAAYLSRIADSVTGVDLSRETIAHARRRYRRENLDFVVSDCCDLELEDDGFDCIVSFETLEHLENQTGMLEEFRRVLRPDGFLVISSPDKAVYSEQQQFNNEFHIKELYRDEFLGLIADHFPAQPLFGQKLLFHSVIWSMEPNGRVALRQMKAGEVETLNDPGHTAMYYIALCAADESCLPEMRAGLELFDDADESVYEHYQHEIRKNMSAGKILAQKERELADMKSLPQATAAPRSWWQRWFHGH